MFRTLAILICIFASALMGAQALAQDKTTPAIPEKAFSALRWRMIGPHRGGRVLAVSGVQGQPNTFYFGAVGGGVRAGRAGAGAGGYR